MGCGENAVMADLAVERTCRFGRPSSELWWRRAARLDCLPSGDTMRTNVFFAMLLLCNFCSR